MKSVIVLAMHGAPPKDFPKRELVEFLGLHARTDHAEGAPPQGGATEAPDAIRRYAELNDRMRSWPRTPENDPFWAASREIAARLEETAGAKVILAFNEFCGPTIDEALDTAAADGAGRVIVVTPMLTRGGEHSQEDIPRAIARGRERHPAVEFMYAWPFDTADIAEFLAARVREHLEQTDGICEGGIISRPPGCGVQRSSP